MGVRLKLIVAAAKTVKCDVKCEYENCSNHKDATELTQDSSKTTDGLYGEKERIQNPPHFFVMVSSWYHHGRPRQVKPQVTLSYLESRYKLCSDLYSSI
jgi:hypothetical protein